MITRRSIIPVAALAVCGAVSSAIAQARIFLQLPGAGAVSTPPAGLRIAAHGGDVLTFWAMGERSPVNVRGCQVMLPCRATGGDHGTAAYVAPPRVNTSNPAFLYYGLGSFPVTDSGACPAPPPPDDGNPRIATAADMTPSQPMFQPRYLGEFVYTVSWDARGEFVIDVPNEPGSAIRDSSDMPVLFTTAGVTIVVGEGQCCVGGNCAGVMSSAECESMGGTWINNPECEAPCGCNSDRGCQDRNPCTLDRCLGSACDRTAVAFGDLDGQGPDHPTVDDLLCALRALSDPSVCPGSDLYPPCTGDGEYDIRDVEVLLSAFGGIDLCGCASFALPPPVPPLTGPARMFLQHSVAGASSTPLEGLRMEVQGGEVFTLWVLVEQVPTLVHGVGAMFPCSATAGDAGSVYFVPPVTVNRFNPDYIFHNVAAFHIPDDGDCPAPPPPAMGNPRIGQAASIGFPPQPARNPKYFGEISYFVSTDAEGEFQLPLPNEPSSGIFDPAVMPVPFVTSGVIVVARTGQCCVGGACQGVMTRAACAGAGGTWRPNRSCADGCGCSADGDCRDDLPCTRDLCIDGVCTNEPVAFGNADGLGPQRPTIDDIMCVLRGITDPSSCPGADLYPPCLTDGVIDEMDLEQALNAFAGNDPCGCMP